jgi:opacity protein-like surface antigen
MRKKSILMFVVLLGCVPKVLVGEDKFGFELGGFAGGSFWKERDFRIGPPQAPEPISLRLNYEDKILGGARVNFLSRGRWGGELSYGYQKNKVTLTRQDANLEPLSLDGSIHQFFYNTVFYLIRYGNSPVLPFVTGGIGLEAYGLSDQARAFAADPMRGAIGTLKNIDTRFAFNYGAGIKANLGSHFGIRVDFRHIFSDVPSYGLPKESANPAQIILPIQGKLQNYEGSVGIYFRTSSGLGN